MLDLQLIAVAVIVALAGAYVARATWRAWAGRKGGCASGCVKCTTPVPTPEGKGRISLPQI
jgi:hypothetical protein